MIQKAEKSITLFLEGVLVSYSQVFFSKQKVFAFILMAVTFFDWLTGFSGLVAVLVANVAASLIGYHKHHISQGLYGFNSLLVGLGIGSNYEPGLEFFFVLVFASLFTVMLTVWIEAFFAKYGLPYLSWPFLIGLWIITLASRQFSSLHMSERGIFYLNDLYSYGGLLLVKLYQWVGDIPMHISVLAYFKSLAAIFFQENALAGLLIAVGIVFYSRIAFLLSLVGFFSGYLYYLIVGANLSELIYSYIGFNYILTAIALGGFFIVPSRSSFLWVILLTPIISFVITSTSAFFGLMGLSIYSLGFNLIVILFLYVLKFRIKNYYHPELVVVQQFSPERNLYSQQNYKVRFDVSAWTMFSLPVIGEWTVTQGHDGKHTHRDDWRHAWDFELQDEDKKTWDNDGLQLKDYYCYGKPVAAPADGLVQEVLDGVPDNLPGQMNLGSNWGNTIVIKHADKVYSKLCHLKPGSIKTIKGAFVKKGEIIAQVGNSGRSPIPHLHFQMQADPFIGSKTLDYPLASYLLTTEDGPELITYARPKEGQMVSNIVKDQNMVRAFNFVPGQTISFEMTLNTLAKRVVTWEVKSDMYNYTYLECLESESKAYFYNTGSLFYFTHFEGDKTSLLYYFYLATYKIVLGYHHRLRVSDTFPLNAFRNRFRLFWHDFAAPFYFFMSAVYTLDYVSLDDNLNSSTITLKSRASLRTLNRENLSYLFDLQISDGRISRMSVHTKDTLVVSGEIAS